MLAEKGDLEGARALFNEAAGIEAYCVEAIYNLGLVNLRLGEAPVRANVAMLVALSVGMTGLPVCMCCQFYRTNDIRSRNT